MDERGADHSEIEAEVWNELVHLATDVRERAWAPYSEFPVGAALLTASGEIVTGCNIENASIGGTICAERTALGTAVAQDERDFRALCIVTDTDPPAAPCGICRQVLSEFCADLPILLANCDGVRERTTLTELFPNSFARRHGKPSDA